MNGGTDITAPSSGCEARPATTGTDGRIPAPQKRPVCDHCRQRRIRCDGFLPCRQCNNASLTCKREHISRKRGPKRGHGRVLNALRAQEQHEKEHHNRESSQGSVPVTVIDSPRTEASSRLDGGTDSGPHSTVGSVPSTPTDISWNKVASDPRNAPDPSSVFTSEQYRPTSRNYLGLVPLCVDLYYEHIYPIMPLPYMPAVREMISRPMTASEKNYIYALCALTSFHMLGQSIATPGLPSWEVPGRFFLDECIAVRQSYDFLEDVSLHAVVSSFWLSTSHFEINQNRKSWLYLREALTLALELGIQDDSTYVGLSPEEKLCRQRVFWQLFVTERSFAILRNKPITFKKTPSLPTTRHTYELPDIHSGFLQLITTYVPLDESFVAAWNDGSDPRVSATTYLALQNLLSAPPPFLSHSSSSSPNTAHTGDAALFFPLDPDPTVAGESTTTSTAADPDPETTAIQKADLLITQQWLRLIVWQSSFRQGLLSWAAPHAAMHFSFPLAVARRTAAVLQALPPSAVEVHGMGIFEKIFEIGTWCTNVLGACDANAALGLSLDAAPAGMDFAPGAPGGGGVLGVARLGAVVDPLEFFVRTLSASPASRTKFAERLLLFAGNRPGGMRMALSPAPSLPAGSWVETPADQQGSVLGEVLDETEPMETCGDGAFDPGSVSGADFLGQLPDLGNDVDFNSVGEYSLGLSSAVPSPPLTLGIQGSAVELGQPHLEQDGLFDFGVTIGSSVAPMDYSAETRDGDGHRHW